MIQLAADENLDNDILRGLQRRFPDLDIVRIQDTPAIRLRIRRSLNGPSRKGESF